MSSWAEITMEKDEPRGVEDDERTAKQQTDRALLRRRFLETLVAMRNQKVQFSMHGGTNVEATFEASDIDILLLHVSNLQTPIGVQPEALLRCSDVISYTFKPEARTASTSKWRSPLNWNV